MYSSIFFTQKIRRFYTKKRRLLSILLALAMILTFMPAIAFADDSVAKIGDTEYDSLRDAVQAINDGVKEEGSTIILLRDDAVSFHDGMDGGIPILKGMTIDGNGHTVSGLSFYTGPSTGGSKNVAAKEQIEEKIGWLKGFYIKDGDVTIKDLSMTQFGDKDYANKFGNVPVLTAVDYNDNLTLDNVNIDKFNRQAICIFGGNFEITGCTINGNSTDRQIESDKDILMYGIEIRDSASGTISDVTVRGMDYKNTNYISLGIVSWSTGNVTLKDVDIDVVGAGVEPDINTVIITGDKTTVKGTDGAVFVEDGGKLKIEDGKYYGDLLVDEYNSTIDISGGTFDSAIQTSDVITIVGDKVQAKNTDGTVSVIDEEKVAATIGADNYTSAEAAVKYAEKGDTVDVKKADAGTVITTDKDINIKNDSGNTINVNGEDVAKGETINTVKAADLSAAKKAANAELDAVDLSKYSEPEKTTIDNAIATAKKDIAAATGIAAVDAAKKAAFDVIAAQPLLNKSLPKVTATKGSGYKKMIRARWKKLSKKKIKKISGYEVQYAKDSKFTKDAKIVKAGKNNKVKTIKKLPKKTTYWVRVRTYKVTNGVKTVGTWSKVKKMKTK